MLIYLSNFIGDYFKQKLAALSAELSEANREKHILNLENEHLHSINEQLINDTIFCQNEVIELQSQNQE